MLVLWAGSSTFGTGKVARCRKVNRMDSKSATQCNTVRHFSREISSSFFQNAISTTYSRSRFESTSGALVADEDSCCAYSSPGIERRSLKDLMEKQVSEKEESL